VLTPSRQSAGRDLAPQVLSTANASLLHLRALTWAVERLATALKSADGSGAELRALAAELRSNRTAVVAALLDTQEALDRLLDASGALPRGLVNAAKEAGR
jgi:hypothetical protein